ncbi:MAG TPA: hypothetical protein VMF08_01775 [Candidatus Sulfotelmatobacter sp.]|nr:hypothetical protein [Candidatus Sulfotelmatobacter sp.]
MIPFHRLFPELAQRETRCVHVGASPDPRVEQILPADEYAFLEFYCEKPDCDCRRVFLMVVRKGDPDHVLASIEYGWEKESFYRNYFWDEEEARQTVRGRLDPINEQSEFAEDFLVLFRQMVADVRYNLRLRRHYRMFKEELARHPEKLKESG